MTNNEINNMNGKMSFAIVLWVNKLSKQVCTNDHKHKSITQHFKLITVTMKSLYNKITTAFTQLHIYRFSPLHKTLFQIKMFIMNE